MKRILFVDDDPDVLAGLQRVLFPMRHEWEVAFARGGPAALEILAARPFDVVITDLRMAGMDGAQLLAEVRHRYPQVVRMTLSGEADRELQLRAAGPAHQSLAKPCDPETLKNAVARACAVRDLLANASLQALVARLDSLPSLPGLYHRLVAELGSPKSSIQTVGALVGQDPGMTAKILQLVNSAFFGLPRRISSPAQAASLLGLETIKALVLSVHVFSQLDRAVAERFHIQSLQWHCLATASLARRIAAGEHPAAILRDAIPAASLLHDVGILALVSGVPQRYEQVLVAARERGATLWVAERNVLGATHAEVGAYLLGLWGLSDLVVEAVAFHHNPGQSLGTTFSPLTAVHVADVLERDDHASEAAGRPHELDMEYLTRLGLAERLPAWRELARTVGCERVAP